MQGEESRTRTKRRCAGLMGVWISRQ